MGPGSVTHVLLWKYVGLISILMNYGIVNQIHYKRKTSDNQKVSNNTLPAATYKFSCSYRLQFFVCEDVNVIVLLSHNNYGRSWNEYSKIVVFQIY